MADGRYVIHPTYFTPVWFEDGVLNGVTTEMTDFVPIRGSIFKTERQARIDAEREVKALRDELDYAHEELDAVRSDLYDALVDAAGAHDENADLRTQVARLTRQLMGAIVAHPDEFEG